jgi:hypothetical protein
MLIPSVNNSLNELVGLLRQLSDSEYSKPCPALSNATIGEHTRHIVEMFQCLENNYEAGVVNYDKRERNIMTQTDTHFAIKAILSVQENIDKKDKTLRLQQIVDREEIHIESNYNRELLYNLEHCIHHQALIKVAILQCDNIIIDANFGVARSTIEYKKQCAQ